MLLQPVILLLAIATFGNSLFEGFNEDPVFDGYDTDGYAGLRDGYGDAYAYENSNTPASAKELQSLDDIDAFVQSEDFEPAVVGYFDSDSNADDLKAFKELASAEGHIYRFAYTTDKESLEQKKYELGCAVNVYPPIKFINEKYERNRHRYPGKSIANVQSLLEFIRQKAIPLTGELTTKSSFRYENVKKPMITVFTAIDHKRNPQGWHYISKRVRRVAKDYQSDAVFNIANIDDFAHSMEEDYGFQAPISNKFTYTGLKNGNIYYKLDEKTFSVDNLVHFLKDFLAGKLIGKEKSDESHDDEQGGEMFGEGSKVVKLTKDNIKQVLENPTADMMVEFYAPWCGHCQALKPQYERAAEHFKSDNGVIFAAVDATAVDIPAGFEVQGYPTLYFVSAKNKKRAVQYDGAREAEDFIEYVQEHRTTVKKVAEL